MHARFISRYRLLALAALFLLAPSLAVAQPSEGDAAEGTVAEGTEPVLVVTLGSMNQLTEDINYISGAVGQPQAGGMFTVMAGAFTQGVDPTLPMGVVVPLVNDSPEPIAFVPTPDVKTVLKRLEEQAGPADELDDGTLVLTVDANNVFIRQVGSWAVIARSRELIDLAPDDPMSILGEMGREYDLGIQMQVQRVPTGLRNQLIAMMRQGFEQAMQQQPEEEAQAARQATEGTLDQLEQLIQETEELRFGVNIDPSAKQVQFDVAMTAVSGSELATMYEGQVAIPSRFASVIRDDAAAFYHAASTISEEAIEQTKVGLDNSLNMIRGAIENQAELSDQEQADVNALIDRVAELAIDSVSKGKADAGALLMAGDGDLRFVFGAFVADGDEAAQIVKDLAAKVEDQPEAPSFEFDRSTYNGVTMHLVEAEVPEDEKEARKVFGETLRVHIGTAPNAVYLALGNASAPLLQELIDSAEGDQNGNRPLGQLRFELMPILEYAQSIEANETVAAMLDALARSPDPGLVSMVTSSIPNGQNSQITLGEGLLQAIGAAVRQSQRGNGQF